VCGVSDMTIVCSRCDGNHMRSECPEDDWTTHGTDTSWAALMATKEAYRKQAHRLAAENAELKAQVEQEIKNWKTRNRSACEAEQEVARLKELLSERDPQIEPWFRRDEFARDVIEIVYGVLKDDNYTYGERCEIALESILKAGLTLSSQTCASGLPIDVKGAPDHG
jgi:hypothetical protein